MLLTLEEIGIELLMILATGGAMVCFVWLLTTTLIERRELRRLAAARRADDGDPRAAHQVPAHRP